MLSGEHGVPVIGGEYSGCKRSSSPHPGASGTARMGGG